MFKKIPNGSLFLVSVYEDIYGGRFKSLIKHENLNKSIQAALIPPDLGTALLNIISLALCLDPDLRSGGSLNFFGLLPGLLLLVALHLFGQAAADSGSWLPDDHQGPSSDLDDLLEP